jgi:hypothetical protein
MTVTNGARSGVDISDAQRRGVCEHLAAQYHEFGEEPPPFAG